MNVKLKAPQGVVSAGIGETVYMVDDTGHVEVFPGHVKSLAEHGFTVAAAPTKDAETTESSKVKLSLKKDK